MSKEGRYLNAVLDEPKEGSLTPRRRSVCFLGLSVHPLAVAIKRQAGPKENGPAVASATCDPPSGTQDARAQGVGVQGVNRGKGTGFYPGCLHLCGTFSVSHLCSWRHLANGTWATEGPL